MVDRSDDASCLLGLAGLAVERVVLTALGVKIVQLVTDDPDAARCPACRVGVDLGQGLGADPPARPAVRWRRSRVQWRKRRWRCRTPACARQTFTEQVAQVPAGMRTTTRLRTALAVAVEDGRDQSEVAAAHGVSWPTVQRAVVARGAVELVEPEPARVLGMDETRFGRPRWLPEGDRPGDGRIRWPRTDPWETGFVDITGDQALLGQVDGRTSAAVQAWLAARTAGVPGRGRGGGDRPARRLRRRRARRAARRADRGGPLPPDHAREQGGDRGAPARHPRPAGPPRPQDRPDVGEPPAAAARPRAALAGGVGADVERLRRPRPDRADPVARGSRRRNCARCAPPPPAAGTPARSATGSGRSTAGAPTRQIPELTTLAETIETWWPAIEVFLTTGLTNARTEGTNRLIKQVKRAACGFRNRENYRRRVRLHCTRHTRRLSARNPTVPA